MNDTTANHDPGREQLSAFLDDELAPDEARFLLRRLEADPALARHLQQYAAIGEVLRGNPAPLEIDLLGPVQRAIRGEVPPEAPPAPAEEPPAPAHWGTGLMPVARVAAAAAVAAVVVFAVLPRAPSQAPTLAASDEVRLQEELFPTVPPAANNPAAADGSLVGVPGNAAFASYLLKHTNAVGPTVRPDFVAAQRAYDHLQPSSPPAQADEDGVAPEESERAEPPQAQQQ